MDEYIKHPRIDERAKTGPHFIKDEHAGFNGRIAILITKGVSTMWCAYLFAIVALISLPSAIEGGTGDLINWLAQTFLQLVLLSVIMVGQKVSAQASDKRALQTYKDTEAILEMQDEIKKLIQINTLLTKEVQEKIVEKN
jgi:hypothetical protein